MMLCPANHMASLGVDVTRRNFQIDQYLDMCLPALAENQRVRQE